MDLYDLGGWCLIYKLEELFIIIYFSIYIQDKNFSIYTYTQTAILVCRV